MFPRLNVPKIPCPHGPKLPESYEPKVLCSYGFDVVAEWCRFPGSYLTRSLCSQGSMFLGPMFLV